MWGWRRSSCALRCPDRPSPNPPNPAHHTPLACLQGLFGLAKRLFDVDIEPADGKVPVWHEDVRFFCVKKVRGRACCLVGVLVVSGWVGMVGGVGGQGGPVDVLFFCVKKVQRGCLFLVQPMLPTHTPPSPIPPLLLPSSPPAIGLGWQSRPRPTSVFVVLNTNLDPSQQYVKPQHPDRRLPPLPLLSRLASPRPTSTSTPTPALLRSAAAPGELALLGERGCAAGWDCGWGCRRMGTRRWGRGRAAGSWGQGCRAPSTPARKGNPLFSAPNGPPFPLPTPPRMDEVCGQSKLFASEGESVRLPVAHMVCNQSPPVGGKPSLMTFRYRRLPAHLPVLSSFPGVRRWHVGQVGVVVVASGCLYLRTAPLHRHRHPSEAGAVPRVCPSADHPSAPNCCAKLPPPCREVETLFHEFGHAAQHMLTEQQEGLVAGIRGVEWDAVELPSQFMENWCAGGAACPAMGGHLLGACWCCAGLRCCFAGARWRPAAGGACWCYEERPSPPLSR